MANVTLKYADIIPQFDGTGDFAEWIDKLELVAKLQSVKNMESFLPLFLSGGAFQVFQGLTEDQKTDYEEVKRSLLRAFSINQFLAYDVLVHRKLGIGEPVDVYLADLTRLLRLIQKGHVSDDVLKCSFVAGLPESCKKQIQGVCLMGEMTLGEVVIRARTLIKSDETCVVANISYNQPSFPQRNYKKVVCYHCNKTGHLSRDCFEKKKTNVRRCYGCGSVDHIVGSCPEKTGVPSKN